MVIVIMPFRSKMVAMLAQLSLLVISVIQMTSSQSTYDVIPEDSAISSCGRNEHVLIQLVTTVSQLVTANSQLHAAVSQLTTTNFQLQLAVSQLQRDVAELKTEGRQTNATGKLC